MPQQTFVGAHTIRKLDALEEYLKRFLMVFKNNDWASTIYFDAFAGTGELPTKRDDAELSLGDEERLLIQGSTQRALELEASFGEYIFVEKSKIRAQELEARLRKGYASRFDRIQVRNQDANLALLDLCRSRNWRRTRAVVFLDPFGSQVDWQTLAAIGGTKAIDLWYLFPAGLSVHRQIQRTGAVHSTHELLGTPEWRTKFIETSNSMPDLFGDVQSTSNKTATPESVTHFMRSRLMEVFAGGVCEDWLRLGRNDAHWYSLMFACANPSPAASKLALRLAGAVIRSKQRGRTK